MKILIDTSAFIALFFKNDKNHIRAKSIYASRKKVGAKFYTTQYILSELFTKVLYFGDAEKLKLCTDKIDKTVEGRLLEVLDVGLDVFAKSKSLMVKFGKNKISFVDCSSFILYRDLSLSEIFAFDEDFKKLGATVSC